MKQVVGPNVARRGNAFSRALGRFILRLLGWRIEGEVPNLPKMVLIGAPHTSNMDGVIGLATLAALGLRAGTMIKDSAFHGPLGVLLRWLGAIPINRRSPKGVIEQSVEAFNRSEHFMLLIAPEGTRHAAAAWKRGYYHVAASAGAAILPAACHYGTKIITFGPPLVPTGDHAADEQRLHRFYAQYGLGRHPERMSKPLCELQGRTWQPRTDRD